jgi:hypothetical protein
MLSDEHAADPALMLSDKNMHSELKGLLDILNPRERKIIDARFGMNGYEKEFTLEEVGEKFGVTRERIRQLQNVAIGKMQRALRRKEKPSQDTTYQEAPSKRVKEIIQTLSSQSTRQKVWGILESSDTDVVIREKSLRSIPVGKGVNWYNLGVRAIRELRKQKTHNDSHKKITYADVETFLRANIFSGYR